MRVLVAVLCLLPCAAHADDVAEAKKRAQACTAEATERALEADKLDSFMKACIASEGPVAEVNSVPLAEKEKQCNAAANSRALTGPERDSFVRSCVTAN
jgi:hypothetical protein